MIYFLEPLRGLYAGYLMQNIDIRSDSKERVKEIRNRGVIALRLSSLSSLITMTRGREPANLLVSDGVRSRHQARGDREIWFLAPQLFQRLVD